MPILITDPMQTLASLGAGDTIPIILMVDGVILLIMAILIMVVTGVVDTTLDTTMATGTDIMPEVVDIMEVDVIILVT